MSDGNSVNSSPEKGGEEVPFSPPSLLGKGAGGSGPSAGRGLGLIPHLLLFLVFLGLWTWKLLEPVPVPPQMVSGLSGQMRLILAKCLHLGGYTFLTVLALTLPASRGWRTFLFALLLLHGAGTEYGQTLVPNRTGKVTDVLIDWAGTALGVLAIRWWRRR
jgi:VanZ family protein